MRTIQEVAQIMGASAERANAINATCGKYAINTVKQQATFIGQMVVESNNFTRQRENMNYSVAGLLAGFSRARISVEDALKYGRIDAKVRAQIPALVRGKPDQAANQQALANILYGGEFGRRQLGNTQPNDGWDFRGGGDKQITGRANYLAYSLATYHDDRMVKTPSLIERLPDSIMAGGWYWRTKGCGPYADAWNLLAVSRIINLGNPDTSAIPNAYEERKAACTKALSLFGAS